MSKPDTKSQSNQPGAERDSVWIRVSPEEASGVGLPLSVRPDRNGSQGKHDTAVQFTADHGDDSSDPESVDLQHWIALLWRRRLVVLATTVMMVALAVAYLLKTTPIYEATASILVPTPSSGVTADNFTQQVPMLEDLMDSTKSRTVDTQVAILQNSTRIQQGALDRLGPIDRAAVQKFAGHPGQPSSPVDWGKLLKIAQVQKTDVVTLSTRTFSPRASTALAQAICDEYIKQSQDNTQSQVHKAAEYVDGQLQKVRQQVDAASLALQNWKQKNNTFDLSIESENRLDLLREVQNSSNQNASDLSSNQAKLAELRAVETQLPQSQNEQTDIIVRPVVQDLESQLTKLQMQLLSEEQVHTSQYPEVITLKEQIASIQSRLKSESRTEIGDMRQGVNPVRQQVEQDIADLKAEINGDQSRATTMNQTIQKVRDSLSQLPSKEYQLSKLTADLSVLKDTYQMLNERYQTLLIGEQGELTNAQVIASPSRPSGPVWPRKGITLLGSLVLGVLIGIVLAAILEALDDRVHSDADAISATHLPVLAHIPFLDERAKQLLIDSGDKTSALLESYRMLRTNISFMALDEPFRSIVITSSQPNEGKSMTSVNLAMALVLSGKRVILVDCDLRRPSVHKLFGLTNNIGFTTVVAGMSTLEAALQDTSTPNLRVLTSGPIPPNPPELIDSRSGRNTINSIIEAADVVILDSPPALVLADAQTVSSIADATILVVSANEAGKRQIQRTAELLTKSGRVLGVVLNKVQATMSGYYGYGGYYGYKAYGSYLDAPEGNEKAITQNRSNNGTSA